MLRLALFAALAVLAFDLVVDAAIMRVMSDWIGALYAPLANLFGS